MAKQRLNSAGYSVIIIGVLGMLATIAALASSIAWIQLKDVAEDTRNLLDYRISQNDAAERQRVIDAEAAALRQEAADKLVTEAIARIQLNTALSVDCAFLRERGLRPTECKEVNERIDRLQRGLPIVPGTTTTTRPRVTSTTSTTRPTTTTTTRPPTTTTTPPCRGVNLLGICIGG